MADFSDLSALIGGSYSAPRFGIAAALAYHREAVRIGERHQSDDAYNIGIAAQAFVGQLRVSLGLAHKSYSLPDIANKNRNAMNDVGVLIAWASSEQGTWHFDGSVGYSWMNNGDEVRTELFGPIQLFTIERGGVWWGIHSPMNRHAPLGSGPVSMIEVTVGVDAERTTSRGEYSRYCFGSEVTLWNLLLARAGYVHDEILANGARDASFGVGVRFSSTSVSVHIDFARFPVLKDVHSNSLGAELNMAW
jgi:hypothetical protein